MEIKNRFLTDFLFSTPTFLSGAGTVMNLAGSYYKFNGSNTGLEADEIALRNDFNMIAQDICDVMDSVDSDNELLTTNPIDKYVR